MLTEYLTKDKKKMKKINFFLASPVCRDRQGEKKETWC